MKTRKSIVRKNRIGVNACGGKKGKGCSSTWAGASKGKTQIKIIA